MKRLALVYTFVGLAALAAPLAAQKPDDIPPGHRPPPGLCRIWIDGVPAGQQPAPTDCATAVRNRPANGRVIFGDDYTKREGRDKKDKKDKNDKRVKDVKRLVPPSSANDERYDRQEERVDRTDLRYDRATRLASDGRYERASGDVDDRKRPGGQPPSR